MPTNAPSPTPSSPFEIGGNRPPVFINVNSDHIQITEDKVRLHTRDFIDKIVSNDTILALISLSATLVASVFSSNFSDIGPIKGDAVGVVFALLALSSGIWTLYTIIKRFRNPVSIDILIAKFKGTSPT